MSNITLLNQDLPDFLQNAGVSELTRQLAGRTGVKLGSEGIFGIAHLDIDSGQLIEGDRRSGDFVLNCSVHS